MSRRLLLPLAIFTALAALAVPATGAAAQGSVCAPCDSTQRAALTRTLRGQLAEVQAELARLQPALERLSADIAAGEPMTEARVALVVREHELRGVERELERSLARLGLQQRRITAPRTPHPERTPRAAAPRSAAAPAGYIGVSFSGAIEPRPGARRFFFHDYPQIVSVDAGSPAERGGLQAGDVLVTLGGTELRGQGVDLGVVLRPGARVPVRYRRDGELRQATLVVASRPMGARADPAATRVLLTPEPARAPLPSTEFGPPLPPAPAAAPLPPILSAGGMTGGVAGAEVARVQGNLREILGVDGGLLVLDVGMGTPAARAGLRAGDVIRMADGEPVRAPIDLVRAVRDARASWVKLDVVRKKETLAIVLRW